MTVEKLQKQLADYPKDMQVFLSRDEEGNAILKIFTVEPIEIAKSNSTGSFDGIVIVPSNERVNEWYEGYND